MKSYGNFTSVPALYSFQFQSSSWIFDRFSEWTKSVLVNCWAEIRVTVEADEMDGEWSFEPISTRNSTHWSELHFGSCSHLKHSGRLFEEVACIYTFSANTVWHFSQTWRVKVQNCSIQEPSHPGDRSCSRQKALHFPAVNARGSCEINGAHCSRKPHFSYCTKCQHSLESKPLSPLSFKINMALPPFIYSAGGQAGVGLMVLN